MEVPCCTHSMCTRMLRASTEGRRSCEEAYSPVVCVDRPRLIVVGVL